MNYELESYFRTIYEIFLIPIFILEGEEKMLSYPEKLPIEMFDEVRNAVRENGSDLLVYSDEQFLSWAYLKMKNTDQQLLIGPLFSTYPDDDYVRTFMKKHNISEDKFNLLREIFDSYKPSLNLQLFSVIRLIHMDINHEYLNDEQLYASSIGNVPETHNYKTDDISRILIKKNRQTHKGTFNYEQNILHYIETGNKEMLHKLSLPYENDVPNLTGIPISQLKVFCISIITLISRHCINKGLDVDISLDLCDLYMKGIDRARNFNDLIKTVFSAYDEYSDRLQKNILPENLSPLVEKCVKYINQSVSVPLSAADVAKHAGRSHSYVCAKFTKEMNCSITEYINKTKIIEAENLLAYSDMSIAEISSYLCFTDQSYFNKVFFKYSGTTPSRYRTLNKNR